MSNALDTDPMRPSGNAPVRTAAVVIYAALVLLALSIPQSLVNRLRDMEENPVQQVLLSVAETVQAASHRIGLDVPYVRARSAFFALVGKEDN